MLPPRMYFSQAARTQRTAPPNSSLRASLLVVIVASQSRPAPPISLPSSAPSSRAGAADRGDRISSGEVEADHRTVQGVSRSACS